MTSGAETEETVTEEPDGAGAEIAPKAVYEGLIAEFGAGWEKGDERRMGAVFTEEALFYPVPFEGPVAGREGIHAYWRDIPKDQAAITFRSGEIFVAGPWFSVEFKCAFRRRRTGEWMEVRGALFCETEDQKISEMRMYWHRTATQREG